MRNINWPKAVVNVSAIVVAVFFAHVAPNETFAAIGILIAIGLGNIA